MDEFYKYVESLETKNRLPCPSEAVQLEAVKQNGDAVQYLKNPSEAVQLEAVKQNHRALRYLKDPSQAVLNFLFPNNPSFGPVDFQKALWGQSNMAGGYHE